MKRGDVTIRLPRVGDGVRNVKNVCAVPNVELSGEIMYLGDTAQSNTLSGDAGRSGDAMWNSDCGGGMRNGFIGDCGDGVSGSQ
jgi:hypothetical protein